MRNKDKALLLLDESANNVQMLLRAIGTNTVTLDEAQRRLHDLSQRLEKVTDIVNLN